MYHLWEYTDESVNYKVHTVTKEEIQSRESKVQGQHSLFLKEHNQYRRLESNYIQRESAKMSRIAKNKEWDMGI